METNIYELNMIYNYLKSQYNIQPVYFKEQPLTPLVQKQNIFVKIFVIPVIVVGVIGIIEASWSEAVMLLVVWLLVLCPVYLMIQKANKRSFNKIIMRDNEEIKKENARIATQNQIIKYNDDIKKTSLNAQLASVNDLLQKSRDLLERYYSTGIIHSKYQNLVAVSSLYEYLDVGICDKLTGPHGAYEHYEYLSRLGAIITRLDDISYKLDQIQQNQVQLYNAVQQSNRLSKVMIEEFHAIQNQLVRANASLDNIESYQYQSSEYNRIAAVNTETMKWFAILRHRS